MTTANIADGSYPATLTGAPGGVAVSGDVVISGNSGTLTVNTTAATPAGTHPLTLTIDGTTSAGFNLVVGEAAPVTVTGVSVLPSTTSVQKGGTKQFSGMVTFSDSTVNYLVTWSVDGAEKSGTDINSTGLLTVAGDETAEYLTVTATSEADGTKKGTATVIVTDVPVVKYTLTVTNGTGGGHYAEGETVNITANTAPAGQEFDKWTTSDSITFINANAASTSFIMIDKAVTVTATYKEKAVVIEKSNPVESTPIYATAVTEGQTLSNSTLSGTFKDAKTDDPVAGTLAWTAPSTKVNATGNFGWTFTPNKTALYNIITGTVKVTANPKSTDGGSGGGGSSTSAPKEQDVKIEKNIENGSITVNPKSAKEGDTVTITVKSDKGYEIDKITVTDKNGKDIKVTEKNGKYTFTMPETEVIIDGEFVPLSSAPEISVLDKFIDVKKGDWYYDNVEYAVKNGLMVGTASNLFSPNAQTSRGMIVTILYRLAGSPEVSSSSSFADIAGGEWYAKAVAWAAESKIIGGFPDGTFGADNVLTREQLVTILYNYSTFKGYDTRVTKSLDNFADGASVSGYAKTAMEWAVEKGIVTGIGADLLSPASTATRAQMAAILQRYIETIVE